MRGFGKNAGEWTGSVEIRKKERNLQRGQKEQEAVESNVLSLRNLHLVKVEDNTNS